MVLLVFCGTNGRSIYCNITPFQATNFKLKVFADDNYKLQKNGRKFSKPIENTVGKGEIAC